MRKLASMAITVLFFSLAPAGFVAAADQTGYTTDQGVYTGGGMMAYPQPAGGTNAGNIPGNMNMPSNFSMPPNAGAPSNMTIPAGIPLDKLRQFLNPAATANQLPGTNANQPAIPQQQVVLTLKTEPGDTLVSLSWMVTGIQQKPGDQPLTFAVFYGIEPGRYDKKIEVGSVTDYKLRELKNNQVYFVKIQGYTRDGAVSLFSNEERVTPLATEELGSPLEQSFGRKVQTLQDKIEVDPFNRQLKQFGYDFFKNSLATGVPTENLPVGGDYVIGPGDSLHIDMWGSVTSSYDLQVDRNGEIAVPKVGVLKVWGLSYAQAKEAINRAISHYYRGYELNVTLGKLRTIQVFVVGEVETPGTYTIGSLGTVINALTQAGGPSKNGSLRAVRVLKGGKTVQDIDLYDMFLSGDRSKDVRLENGDTVFVSVIGPVAAVAGEVKRPAIYELKGTTNLAQLLAMAGGVTAAGDTGRIQLERFEGNSSRVVLDYEAKQSDNERLEKADVRDRDMVKVFPVFKALREVVTLQGNVVKPGEYQFRKGMRLADLVRGYDALLPDSYLDSVQITRIALPDYHREVLSANLAKALAGDAGENIEIRAQDTVTVNARAAMEEKRLVSVNGEVLNPGMYDYYDNMRVRDLINLAGSLKRNAFLDNAELTRIEIKGGAARSVRLTVDLGKALAGDPAQNIVLQPNDSLIVRGIPDWLEATDRFVTLKGEVVFPGIYSIGKGEKLSSVIARAGGFTDKAYLKGAKFTRKTVMEDQQKRMDEVIARSEQEIMRKQGELASLAASKEELEATKASLEGLMRSLEKLKTAKAEGRVVIYLASPDEFRNSPYDITMMGGDVLVVPQTPNVVNVLGQVYNPTTLVFMPGETASYYLKKAGGPTRDAEEGDMYILKADGSVVSRQQSSSGIHWDEDAKRWTFGGFMSASLDPGDTLVVPQTLERIAWMREIKDVTTILSQIALTAGVVVAAGL
ncbi:MAG TPA: SLBB domain-containing protein [Geobacteraceae bacterium]